MKQLMLEMVVDPAKVVIISGRGFHHLVHVLRKRIGDSFSARSADAKLYCMKIGKITEDSLFCNVVEEIAGLAEFFSAEIVLVQALLKGKKNDQIIRQATELGVEKILLVETENSVVRLNGQRDVEKKLSRWRTISLEASEQCGRDFPPKIVVVSSISDIALPNENCPGFFFHEKPVDSIAQRHFHEYLSPAVMGCTIVIGPEGGLAAGEIDQLMRAGYFPVFLNTNILRSETAAVASLSIVRYFIEELFERG